MLLLLFLAAGVWGQATLPTGDTLSVSLDSTSGLGGTTWVAPAGGCTATITLTGGGGGESGYSSSVGGGGAEVFWLRQIM